MKTKFTIGKKLKVNTDIPTSHGMLYEGTSVKVRDIDFKNNTIRVTDDLGKIWTLSDKHLSL